MHLHEPEERDGNLEIIRGDILKPGEFAGVLRECQIVCHLAAIFDMFGPPTVENVNDPLFDNIIRGTYNLLESAVAAGNIELFLYASSDAVFLAIYKRYETPVTEEVEVFPRPGRFYAVAKAVSEQMCINYQKAFGLPYTIIRVGWTLSDDEVLEIFSYEFWEILVDPKEKESQRKRLANGKAVVVPRYPNGEPLFVHLADPRDTATGFVLAIENLDRGRNNVFNIVGYAPFSYLDVIDKVADGLEVPWENVRISGPEKYEISNEKARRLLGYRPRYSIDSIIERALAKKK